MPVFVLQQELSLWEVYPSHIAVCDAQIEQCLGEFAAQVDLRESPLPPPKRRQRNSGNAPDFDLRTHLYRISGVDFNRIDGLGVLTVQTILSEVGLDPTRFPTVKHFTSWLGLCPGSRITGGKVKSSQTRPVVNRAAKAFRLAAQCLRNSPTALGAFYRRLRTRLGAPKAITATAHKLARLFYRLWTTKEEYTDPGANSYQQQERERMLKNLKQKAQALGFNLVPQSPIVENVS